MKRVISILTAVVMLAVLASIGGVTKAHADDPGGLTCNGSVTAGDGHFNASSQIWFLDDSYNCNQSKTRTWEVQYNTQANPNQWHDFGPDSGPYHTKFAGDCANGCNASYDDNGVTGCASSGSIYKLRLHWWWGDGDAVTNNALAGNVCNNGTVLAFHTP